VLGAGRSSGDSGMDAANLLKPMLARGTLRCIGATTLSEYRKYIEKDSAFERRFQQVLSVVSEKYLPFSRLILIDVVAGSRFGVLLLKKRSPPGCQCFSAALNAESTP
jgi:hypothetical protein